MIKDVVYRGESQEGLGGGRGAANLGKGVYYAWDRRKADDYAGRDGVIKSVIINVQDPLIVDINKNHNRMYDTGIENVSVKEASTNADNPNGKDALISYEYILPELYDRYNKYTGYYTGEVNVDGTPVQNKFKQTPEAKEIALASESQVYELGSQKDLDGFAEFVGKKPGSEDVGETTDPVGDGPVPGDQLGLFGNDGQQNRTNKDGCVG